jgi:hypothetical protein
MPSRSLKTCSVDLPHPQGETTKRHAGVPEVDRGRTAVNTRSGGTAPHIRVTGNVPAERQVTRQPPTPRVDRSTNVEVASGQEKRHRDQPTVSDLQVSRTYDKVSPLFFNGAVVGKRQKVENHFLEPHAYEYGHGGRACRGPPAQWIPRG